ncbi:MAG TPA: hypothetical protein V6C82_02555 [Chroococcales cyanobacterium]
MDLPFLNNDPQPAPQDASSDFWNFGGGQSSDGGGYGDDVTLNELLALYQTANEAAPPFAPVNEPEAYPVQAAEPTPFSPPAPIQSMSWEAPEAPPVPYTPPEPIQSMPWEAPEAPPVPYTPPEPVQSNPWDAGRTSFAAPQPIPWEAEPAAYSQPAAPEPMAPVYSAPEPAMPVYSEPPAPEPVVPVYSEPEPEISYIPQPIVTAPAVVEPSAMSRVIPAASVAPVPVRAPQSSLVPMADLALITPEARRDATTRIESIAGDLAHGIDAIQGQLNQAYERLADAAASRAPVFDIIEITNSLSEVKGQLGEQSPLYQQALALRQMADSYLELLKSF